MIYNIKPEAIWVQRFGFMPIPEVGEADVDIDAPEHVKNFHDFGRLWGHALLST